MGKTSKKPSRRIDPREPLENLSLLNIGAGQRKPADLLFFAPESLPAKKKRGSRTRRWM